VNAAQQLEKWTGDRDDTSLLQLAIQTGLGGIPGMGPGRSLLRTIGKSAAQGGVLGGGAVTAESLLERGELPSGGELATGAGMGAAFGGTFGGVLGGASRALRGRVPIEPPAPQPAGYLPAGSFTAAPDGRVGRPGDVIDVPPDVSGGRTVHAAVIGFDATGAPIYSGDPSASSVPRPIRGALPPGRRPIITDPPAGSVPVRQADPSGGRTIPAAVASFDETGAPVFSSDPDAVSVPRRISGLLPVGRKSIITPPPPGSVPRVPTAEDAGGRSMPAAVLAREFDPTVHAKQGVRVTQFSGDPDAVDAPLFSPEVRSELERMREEMRTFAPEHASFLEGVEGGNRPNVGGGTGHYAPRIPGAKVAEDIRITADSRSGNEPIAAALEGLLSGQPASNKLMLAAMEVAQARREGRPGFSRPQLPDDWRTVGSGGGGPAAVDDGFAAFSQSVDEIEPGNARMREPGEEGFIASALLPKVACATVGAAAGGASGDSPEDRASRALLGAGAGFAGGAGWRVGSARRRRRHGPRSDLAGRRCGSPVSCGVAVRSLSRWRRNGYRARRSRIR
jgi:hypothetical protein